MRLALPIFFDFFRFARLGFLMIRFGRFLAPAAIAAVLLGAAHDANAQDRASSIGTARLFSNDYIGDGQDRWRSGSFQVGILRAREFDGGLPNGMGALWEWRLRSEILAPANLVTPDPDDRRYVGILAFGRHHWFQRGNLEVGLGADLVITGPQTGIGRFQTSVHELLGMPVPAVLGDQHPDRFYGQAALHLTRPIELQGGQFRPFVEAVAGPETFVRLGGDFVFGANATGTIWTRDVSTGQLMAGTRSGATGMTFLVGGDITHVFSSAFLPASEGFDLTTRQRLRAGLSYDRPGFHGFYGLSWVGPEFANQPEGQLLGSITLQLQF